jgi:CRISPR/Cas system CMR subunit Cmr4 (Cas7 group RAMP superfamily)
MKTDRVILHYRLIFTTAFHFGTGLRAGLVHRAMARDPDGLLYVPGSTFKGVLRDAATAVLALAGFEPHSPHNEPAALNDFARFPDPLASLFGTRVRPGPLAFDDAPLCREDREFFQPPQEPGSTAHQDRFLSEQLMMRTRVHIARRSGTARRGMLFSSEYGRAELRFDGRIAGQVSGVPTYNDARKTYSLVLLLAALLSVERLGGGRTAGAGRVTPAITELILNGESLDDTQRTTTIRDYLTELPTLHRDMYELQREISETEEGSL